ncbi:MAG: Maebl, partial [Chitinophagaceae bacterium]|nr:Maebl [Chitinophagaceae bacterium]
MENKMNKIALLVDGDNAQPKLLSMVLEEASKYGKVTVRRVYGDWTTPH